MKKILKKTFKWLFILGLLFIVTAGTYIKYVIVPKLPNVKSLKDIQLQTPLSIYSEEGLLIAKFGTEKRTPVVYDDMPQAQINAFLAAEDKDFFQHYGVDFFGLTRAAVQLILTGEKKQGGSTITMQVARNFFLSKEKTYTRKLREILLSFIIEQQLSKQEIITLYLNKIYLGHRSYGIAAAASVYYDTPLDKLSLAQQAMIAGLPKAPSAFNPITNPKRALTRRNYVLNRLLDLNYIKQHEFDLAIAKPITALLHSATVEVDTPYVAEMVRSEMHSIYGDDIYTSGMQVYTTISGAQQNAANHAVRNALHEYDKRHGYRGILGHTEPLASNPAVNLDLLKAFKTIGETKPAIVTAVDHRNIVAVTADSLTATITWEGLKWAWPYINENKQGKQPQTASDILAVGDIIRVRQKPNSEEFELAQVPSVSGAFVSMNPKNGALTSLVGGYDFYSGKFNRATQAKRQPGSGFKPILYSAALEKGYTTATLINDSPVVFDDPGLERQWRPENYSGEFFGPTRLREALTHSRNLVSIRILRDVGVNYVRQFASRFGIDPETLPKNLSLSLGTSSTNPYQMAATYSVFANGGFRVEPFFIDRILTFANEELFRAKPATVKENLTENASNQTPDSSPLDDLDLTAPDTYPTDIDATKKPGRVISPQLHFLINSLLRGVVNHGTGRRALSLGRSDLAGKTGTTNDQRDAWFNGFNPSLVAIAWVGFDNSKPLGSGETGGKAALPIWIDFMREAMRDKPNIPLSQPDGIVRLAIDSETGLKTDLTNENFILEYFREENIATLDEQSKLGQAIPAQQEAIEELF